MRGLVAGVLLLLSVTGAWAETALPATADLARTLAVFEQIDPATLPADRRQGLYLAVADALLDDGQQERALAVLADLRLSTPDLPGIDGDEQIRQRLQRIASPVLVAALQGGTSLAALIGAELRGRGEPLPAVAPGEWQIGVLLPLSGRFAAFGQEVRQGLELARTVQGAFRPVRFLYRDTAAENTSVAELVAELAAQPEVLALIGPLLSSEAAVTAEQASRVQLPALLLAPREGVTGGYVFRTALTMAAQIRELAGFAGSEHLRRIVVLAPASRQGELAAGLFKAAIEAQGGAIVAWQSYPPDTVDLRQQLEALAAEARRNGGAPPDALFLPDTARQAGLIIPQLGFSRLDLLQLLGTSAWNDPDLVRLAGPQVEGAVFVDGFFAGSSRPVVSEFVARFRATYGGEPGLLAAQGYDAGRLLLTQLANPANGDRASLRQALSNLRNFPGVTGETRFTPQGETEKRLFLLQVQDGTVVQIN